ncbi:MAG: cob(I)alamin adenosyltransferase [Betaproteobacteria bacterium]|jgi:cob(I)alamin adenosyltransferase|nr:cob(I)alamin adenosyltransferase [Betaproteobacteria bacterium]
MSESDEERHRRKMQNWKTSVDARIAAANVDRGVLVVNTGPGKGKSSSGYGMVLRALGHGMRVAIVQFIKGRDDTGELRFFARYPQSAEVHVMGSGFTWETQDKARDMAEAGKAWAQARRFLSDPSFDLILLDELNIALRYGYLDLREVLDDLRARPATQHVVVTGRNAPAELIEIADTVTEMTLLKHAFKAGVRAQPGIEW